MSEIDHKIYHPIDKSYSTPASLISPLCIHHVNDDWNSSECPYSMEGGAIPCLQEYPYFEAVYNATGTIDESGETIVNPVMLYANFPFGNRMYMTIDGALSESIVSSYTFDSIGEHTVRFYCKTNITNPINYAFVRCYNLIEIKFPATLVKTSTSMFHGCNGLKRIYGFENVEKIGSASFYGTSLEIFIVPYPCTSMEGDAFYNMNLPNGFICPLFAPPVINYRTFFRATFKIYVPAESLEAYKTASNWSAHASRIYPMTKSMRLKYPPR